MAGALPVSIKDFSTRLSVYARCRKNARLRIGSSQIGAANSQGVAVSGGVDSMALCTLLQLHRDREGWPKDVFSYTVDHKVRPESQQEARLVGEWTTKMGMFIHAIEADFRIPASLFNAKRKLGEHWKTWTT